LIKTDKYISQNEVKKDKLTNPEILKLSQPLASVILDFLKQDNTIIEPITLPYSLCNKDSNKLNKEVSTHTSGISNLPENKETVNKDFFELKEEEPFMIQFPRIIPYDIQAQKDLKEKESNIMDENKRNVNSSDQQPTSYFETKFVNSFCELSNLDKNNEDEKYSQNTSKNLKLGKIKVYKSGKIKMIIGDNTFDVTQGIKNSFAQDLLCQVDNKAYILGKLKSEKLLVAPQIK
jgi:hypothetical protein